MSQTLNEFARSVGLREVRTDSYGVNVDDHEYASAVITIEKAYKLAIEVGGPGTKLVLQGSTDDREAFTPFDWSAPKSLVMSEPVATRLPLITLSPEGSTINIPGDWSMGQVSEFFTYLRNLGETSKPSDSEKKSERIICALLNQLGGEAYVLDGELEKTGVTFNTELTDYDGWHLSLEYT